MVRHTRLELLLPVVGPPDHAEAVLAFGMKRSEEPYTPHDCDLLAIIATQLALLLDRPLVLSAAAARPGDAVLVSGPIGDHGITVMLARGELDLSADIVSDTAPLHELTAALLDAVPEGVRLLRDATRGGVATICNEVAVASQVAVVLDEAAVPVRPEVRSFVADYIKAAN